MYKIIIYYNDLEIIRNICNNLFFQYRNLKIMGVAKTEDEFIDMYKRINPNIVLTSQELLKSKTVYQLFNKTDSKIILCKNKNNFRNSKSILYITENPNYNSIKKDFNHFLYNVDERYLHKKIHKYLEKFGFDFKLTGTNYLFDAILYSVIHKDEYLFENLEKNVYPHVAEKFNVSIANVKWSIIRSINNMNSKFDYKKSQTLPIEFSEKITSKLLITEVVNRLK